MSDDMDYSDTADIDTSSDFEDSSSVDLEDSSVEVEESSDIEDDSVTEIDDSTETVEEISESADDSSDIETTEIDDSTDEDNLVESEEISEIEESSGEPADIGVQSGDEGESSENLTAFETDTPAEITESLDNQEDVPDQASQMEETADIAESQEDLADSSDIGVTAETVENADLEIPESGDDFLEGIPADNSDMITDGAKELVEPLNESVSKEIMGDTGINDLAEKDSAKGNKFVNGIKLGGAIVAGAVDDLVCRNTNNWAAEEYARSDLDIAQKEHTMIIDTDGNSEMYYDANPGQYEKDVEAMKERRNEISIQAENMREEDRAEFTGKAIYATGKIAAKIMNNDALDHALGQSKDTIIEGGKLMYKYNQMRKMGNSPP